MMESPLNVAEGSTTARSVDRNVSKVIKACPVSTEDKEDMAEVPYRELIGSLLYIARCTHPEISYLA